MKNLKEIVLSLREVARNIIRMNRINEIENSISKVKLGIKQIDKMIEECNKDISIYVFKSSEVKDNDPEKETKLKVLEDNIKRVKKEIENLDKDKEELETKKKNYEEDVLQWQKGEKKTTLEEITNLTNTLAYDIMKIDAAQTIKVVDIAENTEEVA
jgi:chromosome segregation ATPase